MISARQLANSYIARLADEVIQLREINAERAKELGKPTRYALVHATRIAEQAALVARTFWFDMYGKPR